jgi:hypothetical protein
MKMEKVKKILAASIETKQLVLKNEELLKTICNVVDKINNSF